MKKQSLSEILSGLEWVDLTHTLTENTPCWDGCGFHKDIMSDYASSSDHLNFRVQHLSTPAGIGTHIDAPSHCCPDSIAIHNIPLEQLIAPCVMIDISAKAHAHYKLLPEDIVLFEQTYGQILPGAVVIIHTGWSQFWSSPERYKNNLIFPSISSEAAEILLKRAIVGLGIDTLSPDCVDSNFPVHRLILGSGKYIIENIAHADQLPPVGAYLFCLPLKIQDGTEAPIRLIGVKMNHDTVLL